MAGILIKGARNVTVSGNMIDGSCDAGVLLQDSHDIRVKNNTVRNTPTGFKATNCGDIYGEGNTYYQYAHFLKGFEGSMGGDWAALLPLCVAIKEAINGNVGY